MTTTTVMEWSRESILHFLEQERDSLQMMGVKRIGLFGSYVRNEQLPESDVDFLVTFEPFTFVNWMDVWDFLEEQLGLAVDLVPEKDLRPELRPLVMQEVQYAAY